MRTLSERIALALLSVHLLLLCCGGTYYAKLYGFGPLYVTEVVLIATTVLSLRSITAVPWIGSRTS